MPISDGISKSCFILRVQKNNDKKTHTKKPPPTTQNTKQNRTKKAQIKNNPPKQYILGLINNRGTIYLCEEKNF